MPWLKGAQEVDAKAFAGYEACTIAKKFRKAAERMVLENHKAEVDALVVELAKIAKAELDYA